MAATYEFTPWSFQKAILASKARYVIALAGTGTGKTVAGVPWLLERIARWQGDDYLIVAPSHPSANATMVLKPDGPVNIICNVLKLGTFNKVDRIITMTCGAHIYLRSADAPTTLHSIHARAVWMDEPGFIDENSADAALVRANQKGGQYLLTGYPQGGGGWYEKLVKRGEAGDPDVAVFRGKTADSPFYDPAAVAAAKLKLPDWKFAQMFEGDFSRAVGAIYDPLPYASLREHMRARLTIADKPAPTEEQVDEAIADKCQFYGGADYGLEHMAAATIAWLDDTAWLVGCYKNDERGQLTYAQHAAYFKAIRMGETVANYGDPSAKGAWPEFRAYGVYIEPAETGPGSVMAGIQRLIGMVREGKLILDSGMPLEQQAQVRAEWDGYHWNVDPDGNPVNNKLEPVKVNDHILDALRYVVTNSRPATGGEIEYAAKPWAGLFGGQ